MRSGASGVHRDMRRNQPADFPTGGSSRSGRGWEIPHCQRRETALSLHLIYSMGRVSAKSRNPMSNAQEQVDGAMRISAVMA